MQRKQFSTWLVVLPLSFFTFLTICTLSALSTVSTAQLRVWEPTDSPEAPTQARDTLSSSHVVHASIKARRFGRDSHVLLRLSQRGSAVSQRAVSHSTGSADHPSAPTVLRL